MSSFPTLLLACGATLATLAAQAQAAPPRARATSATPPRPRPTLVAQQLVAAAAPAESRAYHLTGRIFDPLGRPLPGATLLVKGTATVLSTDAEGRFALELPPNAPSTLVAGYAGYEDQTLSVSPRPAGALPLTVRLRPAAAAAAAATAVATESATHALRTGDLAPDFVLPTTTGTTFQLSAHRGHPVVLYFYPKDGSSGCTKEACSFRDQYQDFKDLGAEVIGISSDSELSHQAFTEKHALPFPLVSDANGRLRKRYAVPRAAFGLLPGRVTYVLDAEGRVRYVFNSLTDATDHVLNAKEILRTIQ